jgi:hypothetical protein
MSVEETKAVDAPVTVTEPVPLSTEQATSNEITNATSKSLPGTPTNDKAGLFPKLKRNLTTKLHTRSESEKGENKEGAGGESQPTDYADPNTSGDQNLTTPTTKTSKRLSARANEILSDIRGAFKQPLVSNQEPKESEDADKNKEPETTAESVAATTEAGEVNQTQTDTETDKAKKEDLKPNRRLTLRVQDFVRGAWKQPLVSPTSGKKEETTAVTSDTTEVQSGEAAATTEAVNEDTNKSSPKHNPPAFGSWLNIFGGSKAKDEAATKEGEGEAAVSGLPAAAEGETNVETTESPTSKSNKENSFLAIFHNLVKDNKKEEDHKKEGDDKEATEDAEPKLKLPFFKRRKSSHKEVKEAANSTEPSPEEVKPAQEGETQTKEAKAAPKAEEGVTTEAETSDKNGTKKEEEVKKD